ncbi:MAG: hypothetical protein HY270_10585 [Deltaproteobacteria bacterium]|nr:hypothetical protein [Deltaproteobacteria bacterium]
MPDLSGSRWLPRLAATMIAILAAATVALVGFLLWWSSRIGATRSEPVPRVAPVRESAFDRRGAAQPATQNNNAAQPAVPTPQHAVPTPVNLASSTPVPSTSSNSDAEKNKAIARGLAGLAKDPRAAARFGVPP